MEKVIKIAEDVVNDIQAKDIEAMTAKEVITQVIDMHKYDTDSSFMESPVYKTYEKQFNEKRIAFEKAKNKMVEENISADIKKDVKSWNLNYYTNELTLVI